jgi:hypothetical protein
MSSQNQSLPARLPKKRKIFSISWGEYTLQLEGPPKNGTKQAGQMIVGIVSSLLATTIIALLAWMTGCGKPDPREANPYLNNKNFLEIASSQRKTVSEWDSDILKAS